MLGFFRTNQLAANLFLIIYAFLLRSMGLFALSDWKPSSAGVLSETVYHHIGVQGWVPDLVALVLVLIQALLLNVLSARFRISREVTMFPGVFYLLLMSTLPSFMHLSPILLGNTFLILGLSSLFNSYKKTSVTDSIYNVGFWIGVAGLFYSSNFVFILFAIFGLVTLRNFRFKEFLMILIGLVTPIFLAGTAAFLLDEWTRFYQLTFLEGFGLFASSSPMPKFDWVSHWSNYVPLTIFGVLIVVVFLSLSTYFQKQNIRSQKNIQVLYYFIVIAVLTVFFQRGIRLEQLLLLAIPLALLLPLNFLEFKKKELGSGIHLVWLMAILFLQYFLLFM